jgi:hypothetical protein
VPAVIETGGVNAQPLVLHDLRSDLVPVNANGEAINHELKVLEKFQQLGNKFVPVASDSNPSVHGKVTIGLQKVVTVWLVDKVLAHNPSIALTL